MLHSGYFSHCTKISTPQIYSVLRRLANKGFVSAKEEREGNAPPRIVYTIEKRGREALTKIAKDNAIVRDEVVFQFDVILSAMAHLDALSTEQCLSVLNERMKAVEHELDDCRAVAKDVIRNDRFPGLGRAIFAHRNKYLKSEIQWLKNLQNDIRAKGWEAFVKG